MATSEMTIAFLAAPNVPEPGITIMPNDRESHGDSCNCGAGKDGFQVFLLGGIDLDDALALFTLLAEEITKGTVRDPESGKLVLG